MTRDKRRQAEVEGIKREFARPEATEECHRCQQTVVKSKIVKHLELCRGYDDDDRSSFGVME
jgi:hypothetical protein